MQPLFVNENVCQQQTDSGSMLGSILQGRPFPELSGWNKGALLEELEK
jgi:hypothetical protein